MDDDRVTRRTYLSTLLATGLTAGIAGCNTSSDSPDSASTSKNPTATPEQAPQILAHDATPKDDGTTLAVSLEGQDDHELGLARIEYGEQAVERNPESTSVALDDEFTDLGESALDTTPGQATFRLRDADGNETRATVTPDETAPELQTFAVEPTTNAGEIVIQLAGRDETGLEAIEFRVGGQPVLQANASGQQSYSTERQIEVSHDATFQQHTTAVSMGDWNGNTVESEAETYVRKYDVMEDTRLDVGAETFSLGRQMFTNCLTGIETTPAVGVEDYGTPPTTFTSTRHIDQMTGFGVNRVNLTFGTGLSKPNIQQFLDSPIIDHIDVAVEYSIKIDKTWSETVDSWKNDIVEPHMEYIRETILSRDNVATYDGRPLFTVSNAAGGWLPESQRDRIKEEWGSYENFVDDIRKLLAVDGKAPFITGTFGGWGLSDYSNEHARSLASQMDAVRNQKIVTLHDDMRGEWDDTLQLAEESYSGHREFAEENGIDFVPLTGPGFDDRANTCWGPDRLVPRSQSGFRKLLTLADEYSTTDMVDIATWNDWTEGTQIEPGSYRGNNYGNGYLELIKDFQQPA